MIRREVLSTIPASVGWIESGSMQSLSASVVPDAKEPYNEIEPADGASHLSLPESMDAA
jgi:hypothetical protein